MGEIETWKNSEPQTKTKQTGGSSGERCVQGSKGFAQLGSLCILVPRAFPFGSVQFANGCSVGFLRGMGGVRNPEGERMEQGLPCAKIVVVIIEGATRAHRLGILALDQMASGREVGEP